jgi:hypothetical protein
LDKTEVKISPVDSETLLMTDFMNLKIKTGSVFQMCL